MEACREFISAADAVNQMIAERMGVNRTDHRAGGPQPTRSDDRGDLHAAHLTTGAVTAVVDRLEDVGFVRRVRDTDDRRRGLHRADAREHADRMRYYQPFMSATFESMTSYSAEELETVRDFMRGAAELSEEYAGGRRGRSVAGFRDRLTAATWPRPRWGRSRGRPRVGPSAQTDSMTSARAARPAPSSSGTSSTSSSWTVRTCGPGGRRRRARGRARPSPV